jgi:hypothetical protein
MRKKTDQLQPIEIFISYSHRDEAIKKKLITHLSALKREGYISEWHDRMIGAGEEWKGAIDTHLKSAKIILLLISPEFIASDYCIDVEMKRALARHSRGTARVIPVIVRDCDWKRLAFVKLQALPTDGKPVTSWKNRDEALRIVAEGIRAEVLKLQKPGVTGSDKDRPKPTPQRAGTVPQPEKAKPRLPGQPTGRATAPTYRAPKPINQSFSVYKAGDDILKYLRAQFAKRVKAFEKAGYSATVMNREGVVAVRIEANGSLVYGLDIWHGGMSDSDIAYYEGAGRHTLARSGMTGSVTPFLDPDDGRVKLRPVFGLGVMGGASGALTKEELLKVLWDNLVERVDQSTRR